MEAKIVESYFNHRGDEILQTLDVKDIKVENGVFYFSVEHSVQAKG